MLRPDAALPCSESMNTRCTGRWVGGADGSAGLSRRGPRALKRPIRSSGGFSTGWRGWRSRDGRCTRWRRRNCRGVRGGCAATATRCCCHLCSAGCQPEPRCEQVIKRIQHALLAQSYSAWENFVTERQLNQALAKKMVGRLMNRVSTTACERRSSRSCAAHTDGARRSSCASWRLRSGWR